MKNIENLSVLNIGMVGHIDHGKTTLLKAITGKFADSHSEELKRGITIKLGYADVILKKKGDEYGIEKGDDFRYLTFVDVPGHEMLMATMLSGAAVIDVAILVVAANEGIKPQTREHLVALQAKKVSNIIVVQNKIDLVSKEKAIENYKEIKEFLKGTIAENSPIIPISAEQGINLDVLYNVLAEIKIPERDKNSEPLFIVARSFDINRPGKKVNDLNGGVLGGALKRGVLKEGDEIEIKPGLLVTERNQQVYETVKTKVVSIYRGSHKIKEATPGGSLSIETGLDMSLTKADNLSGCVAGAINKLPEIVSKMDLKISLFEKVLGSKNDLKVESVKPGEMLMLSINTSISVGKVIKISKDIAHLQLNIPVVAFEKDNVGIARNIEGHWRLIGFGEVVA
jgi:translation initiation factor 2 subunit 3